jgi:hypothetical protein
MFGSRRIDDPLIWDLEFVVVYLYIEKSECKQGDLDSGKNIPWGREVLCVGVQFWRLERID